MTRKGQNLFTYYQNLTEKTKFIRKVARRCNLSSNAVSKWAFGDCKPSKKEYVDILVDETGIPEANLFNRDLDETY